MNILRGEYKGNYINYSVLLFYVLCPPPYTRVTISITRASGESTYTSHLDQYRHHPTGQYPLTNPRPISLWSRGYRDVGRGLVGGIAPWDEALYGRDGYRG